MTETLRALIAHTLRLSAVSAPGILEGWTDPERGIEFAELILTEQPEVVVEIGVFGGRSLIAQGFALRELKRGHIYGIDPWKKELSLEGETNQSGFDWWAACPLEEIHQKAMKAIWDNGLDEWITVIRQASQYCHQLFNRIDFLSVDGNHAESVAVRDVLTWVPKVRSGGIVFMDDTDWPSTQKAVAELMSMTDLIKDGVKYRICRKR